MWSWYELSFFPIFLSSLTTMTNHSCLQLSARTKATVVGTISGLRGRFAHWASYLGSFLSFLLINRPHIFRQFMKFPTCQCVSRLSSFFFYSLIDRIYLDNSWNLSVRKKMDTRWKQVIYPPSFTPMGRCTTKTTLIVAFFEGMSSSEYFSYWFSGFILTHNVLFRDYDWFTRVTLQF